MLIPLILNNHGLDNEKKKIYPSSGFLSLERNGRIFILGIATTLSTHIDVMAEIMWEKRNNTSRKIIRSKMFI
jgi:hypothetical protein